MLFPLRNSGACEIPGMCFFRVCSVYPVTFSDRVLTAALLQSPRAFSGTIKTAKIARGVQELDGLPAKID